MPKKDSIILLMKDDHGKIKLLVKKLEMQYLVSPGQTGKCFSDLMSELEKHFMVEEKAIFDLLDEATPRCYDMMTRLLQEHNHISSLMKDIKRCIRRKDLPPFEDLAYALNRHREFEDRSFYPVLEKELDSARKREMIIGIKGRIR